MQEVTTDSSNIILEYFEKYVIMSKERKLNTDGKTTYNIIKNRMLPLYYSEFEWRFNHRNCKSIMDKIKNYIIQSSIATRKMIRDSMDQYATARGLENA